MKHLKKLTAIILVLTLVAGCLAVAGNCVDSQYNMKFAVTTDIHSFEKDAPLPVNFPENTLYFHAKNSGNLYNEAVGILNTFLYQAAEGNAQFVLITGDISNSGTEEQHEYLASVLAEFEEATNIPVYVTPGNHDYANSSPADFKKYYAAFGFDEALTVDSDTASYTVNLPGKYRLISIDSNNPGKDGDGFTDKLFSWVEAQCKAAENDGRIPIAMMHHPLLDPIPLAELIMKNFIVRNHKDVAEKFANWGIQYIFTGHEHGNNITSYTAKSGKTVYDVLSTSLTSYPLEYRMVTFSKDKVEVANEGITECNFDYVCEGYNNEQLALMQSNYTEYAKGYFKYSIEKKIAKYITAEFLEDKLKVEDGILYDALETVMPLVEEALQMPLYTKDTDGTSIESLAKAAGATLPASDYYNLYDLATSAVAAVYYGNENMPYDTDPSAKVLIVGLNTGLKYILAEAGNKATTLALNALFSSLGLDKLDNVDLFRWNRALVLGADNSYEIAGAVLRPLLDRFLIDDELPDRDATLPAPGSTAEAVNPVAEFFNKLFDFFRYILSIFKAALPF